jgi:hypothetical protein
VADVPLNFTVLFEGVGSKLVPLIVTDVPTAPIVGEKLLTDSTLKLETLVTVCPPTVTLTGPVVAPTGTVTIRVDELALVTVADVPLNFTVLLDGVGSKLVPLTITDVPAAPKVGEKLLTDSTLKLEKLVAVWPLTVTLTGPVVAPAGTVTTKLVAVALVTVADVPLNFTVLFEGVVLKLVPLIVTDVPTAPIVGVNPDTESTLKLDALVAV